ncbi:MAG: spore coat protein H [Myxococcota bacterium]|jgi:spore coat protein H
MILLVACTGPATVDVDDIVGVDTVDFDTGDTPTDTDTDTGPDTTPDAEIITTSEDCALTSDLDDVWLWEGALVTYTLDCTGSMSVDEVEITPASLPDGATFDAADLSVTWQSGPADGGRVDMVFSVRAQDDEIPTAATFTVWLADNPDLPGAIAPDPLTYTEEWGLPVLFLDADAALTQSDQDVTVTYGGREYAAEAKIRGASSASYPKPSYTLEFTKDEIDLTEEWGETRDHLLLLTTFDDNSYVRQKLIYDQWAAMAEHWGEDRLTPRTFFSVLYLNGEYIGLYVSLDRVDNEFIKHMGFDNDGGLYKAVNHDANFYLTDSGGNGKDTLHDGYEKKEGDPETDFTELDDFVEFTGNASASALIDGLDDWVRTGEMMDWFLLVYYSLSEDSAGKNSYLYADADSGVFLYVPWDFNHAWGQNWYTLRTSASSLNSFTGNNRIFWAIQNDAGASAELQDRYASMRVDGEPMSLAWQVATVDDYYTEIQPSAERDWEKWSGSYQSYGSWSGARSGSWTDFEGEKDYLYQWLSDRSDLFDSNWPQ